MKPRAADPIPPATRGRPARRSSRYRDTSVVGVRRHIIEHAYTIGSSSSSRIRRLQAYADAGPTASTCFTVAPREPVLPLREPQRPAPASAEERTLYPPLAPHLSPPFTLGSSSGGRDARNERSSDERQGARARRFGIGR